MGAYRFNTSCVDLSISGGCRLLEAMSEGREVALSTIKRRLNREEFEFFKHQHGYTGGGVRIEKDPCISYHRIKWDGAIAYVIRWSAIEFIYTENK